jgi:hypothetical protein
VSPSRVAATSSGNVNYEFITRYLALPVVCALAMRIVADKWMDAKGRDSSAARQEYMLALEASASNEPGQVLSMAGTSRGFKRISGDNVPDTGYGA